MQEATGSIPFDAASAIQLDDPGPGSSERTALDVLFSVFFVGPML